MGSHDKLYKAVFSEPQNAVAYFEGLLPTEVTAALDLSRARHEPGSFVDERLTERHTDLLFRIPWRRSSGGEGQEVLLYVIFEHQSTPDATMPLRMLRYVMRIWDRWLRRHPERYSLPPVLPMVLYHGDQDWTCGTALQEMYDVKAVSPEVVDAIRPFWPRLQILLHEIARLPDKSIPGQGVVRLSLLLFKHGRLPGIISMLPGWESEFRAEVARGELGLRNVGLLVEYLLRINECVTVNALAEFLAPKGEEAKEIAMTEGERLIEQGRREGEQRGRQVGEAAGRHNEKLAVARKALAKGMSPADVADLTALSLDEVQRLAH